MKRTHTFIPLIILLLSCIALQADGKLIRALTIKKNRITVHANKSLGKTYLREPYFAQNGEDINLSDLDTAIRIISFLMNIAPIACKVFMPMLKLPDYNLAITTWCNSLINQDIKKHAHTSGGYYTDKETETYTILRQKAFDHSFSIASLMLISQKEGVVYELAH